LVAHALRAAAALCLTHIPCGSVVAGSALPVPTPPCRTTCPLPPSFVPRVRFRRHPPLSTALRTHTPFPRVRCSFTFILFATRTVCAQRHLHALRRRQRCSRVAGDFNDTSNGDAPFNIPYPLRCAYTHCARRTYSRLLVLDAAASACGWLLVLPLVAGSAAAVAGSAACAPVPAALSPLPSSHPPRYWRQRSSRCRAAFPALLAAPVLLQTTIVRWFFFRAADHGWFGFSGAARGGTSGGSFCLAFAYAFPAAAARCIVFTLPVRIWLPARFARLVAFNAAAALLARGFIQHADLLSPLHPSGDALVAFFISCRGSAGSWFNVRGSFSRLAC